MNQVNNPFVSWVREYVAWVERGRSLPVPAQQLKGNRPEINSVGPVALLFSPHPDDETITGALPLRLLRQSGWRIVNIPVTLGSNRERQLERLQELRGACGYLGFEVMEVCERGLEKVNAVSRESDPEGWREKVERIRRLLEMHKPRVVFFPHAGDANATHHGVHLLVMDALNDCDTPMECWLVETEYWAPCQRPNLMVEVDEELLADQIAALTFHVGEIRRNPYHLTLPAWMADNVRRGSELIGGQGAQAASYKFATLYRVLKKEGRALKDAFCPGRFLSINEDPGSLFA